MEKFNIRSEFLSCSVLAACSHWPHLYSFARETSKKPVIVCSYLPSTLTYACLSHFMPNCLAEYLSLESEQAKQAPLWSCSRFYGKQTKCWVCKCLWLLWDFHKCHVSMKTSDVCNRDSHSLILLFCFTFKSHKKSTLECTFHVGIDWIL